MEQTAELQINLFREQLPSIEEIRTLSHLVHSSEVNQMRFAEQVEQNVNSTSPVASLEAGIGLFILGRYREAVAKLQKGPDTKEKFLYLAFALRRLRKSMRRSRIFSGPRNWGRGPERQPGEGGHPPARGQPGSGGQGDQVLRELPERQRGVPLSTGPPAGDPGPVR